MSVITVERQGAVAVVTLASPANRNALTTELLNELVTELAALDADPGARVIVVTGGTELFASGADVRELLALTPAEYAASDRGAAWRRLADIRTPIVAAVAGYALGGGCELALLADLVVAADTATFGQPEIRLGLIPGAGGTQRWARVAGRYAAASIVLTGELVDAFEARQLGLVHSLVPAERVVAAAVALATSIAAHSPLALQAARASIRRSEELGLGAALDFERGQLLTLLSTDDHVEGITAFLEKRRPQFSGK